MTNAATFEHYVDSDEQIETRSFEVDRDIIWSLVFRQNKSLVGAVLELIQNSFDAEAKKIEIIISNTGFSVRDNGKGFSNREQIESWFEVFGFTGKDVDDSKFGRFRMGRGQIMGHSKSTWHSGQFKMEVDVKNKGLNYQLHTLSQKHEGCLIEGDWYEDLTNQNEFSYQLRHENKDAIVSFCEKIKNRVKYMVGIDIWLNNDFINNHKQTEYLYEDDFFYFLEEPDKRIYSGYNRGIQIYNLGIDVGSINVRQLKGDVITKRHMKLNISRSEVQSDCPVLKHIKQALRKVAPKYDINKKYNAGDAVELLLDYINGSSTLGEIKYLRLFHDIRRSKYYSLIDLSTNKFIISPRTKKGKNLADVAHTQKGGIVLHEDYGFTINAESINYKGEFPFILQRFIELYPSTEEHECIIQNIRNNYLDEEKVFDSLNLNRLELNTEKQPKKLKAKINALNASSNILSQYLDDNHKLSPHEAYRYVEFRRFSVGVSTSDNAWTDCKTKIIIEKSKLELMDFGFKGVMSLLMLIAHEYAHISNDEIHDVNFYERFHNNVLRPEAIYDLTCEILRKYDDELAKYKLKAPVQIINAMKICRKDGLSKTVKQK